MPTQKRIPQRKCTGCGKTAPKNELIRVVRSPEGEITIDFTGKKSGRGAYICHNGKCLNLAIKSKRLEKNLETVIPPDIYGALEEELKENG